MSVPTGDRLADRYRYRDIHYVRQGGNGGQPVRTKWRRVEAATAAQTVLGLSKGVDAFMTAQRFAQPNQTKGEAQWCGPFFDLDAEGNVEAARRDAVNLLDYLTDAGIVNKAAVRVYFSGNKGFHVDIAPSVFGVQPHPALNRIMLGLAEWLAEEIRLQTLDTTVYSSRRMWRVPGSQHSKSGLFVIELSHEELRRLSVEAIRRLAVKPRRALYDDEDLDGVEDEAPVDALAALFATFVDDHAIRKKRPRTIDPTASHEEPPCVLDLLGRSVIPAANSRNKATMTLASYFKNAGWSAEAALNRMLPWARGVENTSIAGDARKLEAATRSVVQAVFEGDAYHFDCCFILSLGTDDERISCDRDACPLRAQRDRRSAAARLIALADDVEFVHDREQVSYAVVPLPDGGYDAMAIPERGGRFRKEMVARYQAKYGEPVAPTAISTALEMLAARGFRGPEREVLLRVARVEEALYVDLADGAGRAVRIVPGGWTVVQTGDVLWRRPVGCGALPVPDADGSLDDLGEVLRLSGDDIKMAIAFMLGTFCVGWPYPILNLFGEQGAAKSFRAKVIRYFVDPTSDVDSGVVRPPRKDTDLAALAHNNHAIALDNLSHIPDWLSDALAALATGVGFTTRALYTDRDQSTVTGKHPIIINGIPQSVTRGDLADRAINVECDPIPESERRRESKLWDGIRDVRPKVLGGLVNAVAAALEYLPGIEDDVDSWPRMADFAAFVAAAEKGGALPWGQGEFLPAYEANREQATATLVDASPLAKAIIDFASGNGSWTGTASELYDALKRSAVVEDRKPPAWWPARPDELSKELARLAPALRMAEPGVDVTRPKRTGKGRRIRIEAVDSFDFGGREQRGNE